MQECSSDSLERDSRWEATQPIRKHLTKTLYVVNNGHRPRASRAEATPMRTHYPVKITARRGDPGGPAFTLS